MKIIQRRKLRLHYVIIFEKPYFNNFQIFIPTRINLFKRDFLNSERVQNFQFLFIIAFENLSNRRKNI